MAQIEGNHGKLAIVLLSGGLDSMVSAALAQEAGFRLHGLTIDYGQRHRRELEAAREIAIPIAGRSSSPALRKPRALERSKGSKAIRPRSMHRSST